MIWKVKKSLTVKSMKIFGMISVIEIAPLFLVHANKNHFEIENRPAARHISARHRQNIRLVNFKKSVYKRSSLINITIFDVVVALFEGTTLYQVAKPFHIIQYILHQWNVVAEIFHSTIVERWHRHHYAILASYHFGQLWFDLDVGAQLFQNPNVNAQRR
jgi:hypothetical protein